MNKTLLLACSIITIFVVFTSCANNSKNQPVSADKPVLSKLDSIKHGEYLVTTMGCNDCHSPKRMGAHGPEIIPELMLSGHPANGAMPKANKDALKSGWVLFSPDQTATVGPWGTSFAANLTPDETGIGTWNLDQFRKSLTKGKFMGLDGSRQLLPPMPWQNFTNMSEADLQDIFLYLKNIKAVRNVVHAPIPPDGH